MDTTRPTVLKFGGTSVADAEAFRRVAGIVAARRAEPSVVVVSAMSGMTDALIDSIQEAAAAAEGAAEEAARALEEQFARHRRVAGELLPRAQAEGFLTELEGARAEVSALLLEVSEQGAAATAPLRDQVLAFGELLSAGLLEAVLRAEGLAARRVDSRRCIITDEQFGAANPLMDVTTRRTRAEALPVLEAGETPVLGGFMASALDGRTTVLGRGGSDYTAALVGAALDAREIQIWTDVSGVLTADPRAVPGARTVGRLSFAEAAELAYFGAKVLHPKTILPAVVRGVPVRICNTFEPTAEGTIIYFDTEKTPRTVKAIAHKKGVTIVHVTSARMLGAYGFLRALFEVFDRHRTIVDLVTTSEVSVSLSLEDTSALGRIAEDLRPIGAVKIETGRGLVCVVGEGLRHTPGIAAKVFTAVRDINVMLISQGASSINLTFVVEEELVERAVRRLHEAFFERDTRELYQKALLDQ